MIDWQASKEQWVGEVEAQLIPHLLEDRRFVDAQLLVDRFRDSVTQWRRSGDIRPLINDGNELAAAMAILARSQPDDILRYEPRLAATRKSIDFMVQRSDGSCNWIDFKTVAPDWDDGDASWRRFEAIAEAFPENARLLVQRQRGGAGISGQLLKARWSFVQRTVEAEQKFALLRTDERGPFKLMLCSSGPWNHDDLEDFADFYRTGQFREDDWCRNAMARYLADEHITFDRTLAGFCYLERRHDEVNARHCVMDVRGP